MSAVQTILKYFAAIPLGFTIFAQLFVVARSIKLRDKESLIQAVIVILAAGCIVAGTIVRQKPGPLPVANIISVLGGLLFTYPAIVAYKKLGKQEPKGSGEDSE